MGAAACGPRSRGHDLVFFAGRAVAPVGDSLFVVALPTAGAVLALDRHGRTDTLGAAVLTSPRRIQVLGDTWYVSDVDSSGPSVVALAPDGTLRRRVRLRGITPLPHQFAALDDGSIVVEAPDRRLVRVRRDSVTTFAVTDQGPRPSLVAGANGGVLLAVPNHWITLYNAFGTIRWRIEWPWRETAYVNDVAVDATGRIDIIASVPANGTFVVYTIAASTGEILRWSAPQARSTFVVDQLGAISPADSIAWLRG